MVILARTGCFLSMPSMTGRLAGGSAPLCLFFGGVGRQRDARQAAGGLPFAVLPEIGGPAAARLIRHQIHPMKAPPERRFRPSAGGQYALAGVCRRGWRSASTGITPLEERVFNRCCAFLLLVARRPRAFFARQPADDKVTHPFFSPKGTAAAKDSAGTKTLGASGKFRRERRRIRDWPPGRRKGGRDKDVESARSAR